MLRLLLFIATCLLVSVPASAADLDPQSLNSADRCGECHRDIYRMWQASAHAQAMEDPVFQDAYHETESRVGKEVSAICLTCHAPAIAVNKDHELRERITWEGVGCDICHSMVAVDTSQSNGRLVLDVGETKRGPIRDAESTAHEVAYSDLHTSSLGCAGCHQYTNGEGTPIMTTYSEWQGSTSAEAGKTCQTCHMWKTKANIVEPRVARVSRAEVNLHEMPGGHSLEQLHKALGVGIDSRRQGDELALDIRLTNKGAGHAVPTGMPGRRVIMEVQLRTSKGTLLEERRVYEKSFVDAQGKPIKRDSGFFAPGIRMAADTRIQADERRTEEFRFPVPAAATAYLTVRLHYEHTPTEQEENRTWLTFLSERRTLTPSR